MSYVHKPNVKPLEHRTPFQLLRAHAAAHPKKEAFVFRDLTKNRIPITFQEYERTSQCLASGLLTIGVKRGDRVLLMLPSCPEFLFFHLALNRIGAVAIIGEEDGIPSVKAINKLTCLISKTDYHSTIGQQVLEEIHSLLEEQENVKVVLIGCKVKRMFSKFLENIPTLRISILFQGELLQHKRVMSYEDLSNIASNNPDSPNILQQAEDHVLMDDPFMIMYTSGSTALPKPIEYTNHGFVNGCIKDGLAMKLTADSREFMDSPFDWMPCMGLGIGVVVTIGCTLVVFPPKIGFKGGSTSNITKVMAEEECTHCFVLPYFLHDLVSNGVKGVDLRKLKYLSTGGQPLNIPKTKKLLAVLPEATSVLNVYGSTETCILATQIVHKDNIDFVEPGVLDIAPGFEIKIINPQGQLAPFGKQGEVCARAAWVSFPNPDMYRISLQTPLKPPINNWHHLKDCCSFNGQGQLKLFGRMDFLIKCATESIQPTEVEFVLYKHPDVDKVCVCGVPDQRLYQKICACIVMKAGKPGDEASFKEWSKDNFPEMSLGLSLRPHYYLFMESFPLTRTGKLCRRQTQELAIKKLSQL